MVKQYQKTFIANIKKQHEYLEQRQYADFDEMYRWLHTIKGTGATICADGIRREGYYLRSPQPDKRI